MSINNAEIFQIILKPYYIKHLLYIYIYLSLTFIPQLTYKTTPKKTTLYISITRTSKSTLLSNYTQNIEKKKINPIVPVSHIPPTPNWTT